MNDNITANIPGISLSVKGNEIKISNSGSKVGIPFKPGDKIDLKFVSSCIRGSIDNQLTFINGKKEYVFGLEENIKEEDIVVVESFLKLIQNGNEGTENILGKDPSTSYAHQQGIRILDTHLYVDGDKIFVDQGQFTVTIKIDHQREIKGRLFTLVHRGTPNYVMDIELGENKTYSFSLPTEPSEQDEVVFKSFMDQFSHKKPSYNHCGPHLGIPTNAPSIGLPPDIRTCGPYEVLILQTTDLHGFTTMKFSSEHNNFLRVVTFKNDGSYLSTHNESKVFKSNDDMVREFLESRNGIAGKQNREW